MPIYGYRCEQCGHEVEVLQSMSDEPLRVCPNCMGPLRKMIYPVGIVFKGSGYYTTDYKAAGSASRHGDSDAAASSFELQRRRLGNRRQERPVNGFQERVQIRLQERVEVRKQACKESTKPSSSAKPAAN